MRKQLEKYIEEEILRLNEEQRSNRYIAKELNIARSTVKNYLDKNGKKTNKLYIRLEKKDNQLRCLDCSEFKNIETLSILKQEIQEELVTIVELENEEKENFLA